jgi:Zinc dependent phospholipase C
MASQQKLGLRTQRRLGAGSFGCAHPVAARSDLAVRCIRGGSFTIARQIQSLVAPATIAILISVLMCMPAAAYSVLTHEEIVDLVWTSEIRPLLLKRFPAATPEQIKEAHGYAYGGAVIQDLGYYPFGDREFSDLVHYSRTGDFVRELILESRDVNEYAFALGALSHYSSDIIGHPAVNEAVAIQYPKLRAKYGRSVRYAQDKTAHLKTEFGFDMVQVAKNRYASQQYHDFIGFEVSTSLLERVFPVVYGVELKEVLTHQSLAVGTYRYSVSRLIPQMTQVALQTHKKDMMRETPNRAKKKFLYRLSRSGYEKEWGKDYSKPGIGTRVLSTLLRYIPKVGPFKAMAFNNPTAQTEDLYFKSINATVDAYRVFLNEVGSNTLVLPNLDLDSGKPIIAAEYSLADQTYATLLKRLSDSKFDLTSAALRDDIIGFYFDEAGAAKARNESAPWQDIRSSLVQLRVSTPAVFVDGIKTNVAVPPACVAAPAISPCTSGTPLR